MGNGVSRSGFGFAFGPGGRRRRCGARGERGGVDGKREFGERFVGVAFLVEARGEPGGDLRLAEGVREGPRGAVAGDLVVLDPLGGADERGVAHGGRAFHRDRLRALLDEADHGVAGLALRREPEDLQRLREPRHVRARLGEMAGEGGLQLSVRRGFRHFRQRLQQLVLGVEEVFEFVDEQRAQRGNGGHDGCKVRERRAVSGKRSAGGRRAPDAAIPRATKVAVRAAGAYRAAPARVIGENLPTPFAAESPREGTAARAAPL